MLDFFGRLLDVIPLNLYDFETGPLYFATSRNAEVYMLVVLIKRRVFFFAPSPDTSVDILIAISFYVCKQYSAYLLIYF